IGMSVMQEMRTTGDAQYAPFVSLCPSLVGGPDGFDCSTDCHACSNRDDFPPRLPRPHNKCMLGAAFFAYADEYLVDVKFGSPKVGRDFQRWSRGKKSSIVGRSAGPRLRPIGKSSEASELGLKSSKAQNEQMMSALPRKRTSQACLDMSG